MYSLENNLLKIEIKHTGAELCSIHGKKNDIEFLWQADPTIWGSHAPNLFPIIGAMKNDTYYFNNESFKMPKHGFVRHNENFEVVSSIENELILRLSSNKELYELYPFLFQFEIQYQLKDNILLINHRIKNVDSKPLFFSVGGHPAFNCPLSKDESYSDYSLEFEYPETSESHLLEMGSGLITNKTKKVFSDGNTIFLREDLFDNDALIFKDLNSNKIRLNHRTKGPVLSVNFDGFTHLGIWAKPKAPYVCIEPWIGWADHENTNQQVVDKDGIVELAPNTNYDASYSIEIHKSHLV